MSSSGHHLARTQILTADMDANANEDLESGGSHSMVKNPGEYHCGCYSSEAGIFYIRRVAITDCSMSLSLIARFW